MRSPFLFLLITVFIFTGIVNPAVGAMRESPLYLPTPGTMVHLSPAVNLPTLKGLKVHPDHPFRFDFVLDQGSNTSAESSAKEDYLKSESAKLIKYFLAALTIPEKDIWVNLSPYEKNRIVPESFGQTEMGRDLLAQDYILKQITASLMYPEDEIGKKFWRRVYEEAQAKFGTTNIPVNTFNKVWIIPEKAVVYENAGTVYVVESTLRVMLEEDYLASQKNNVETQNLASVSKKIIKEIIIPELTKEINQGENFAPLRQVYQSLILATWYKTKIRNSILAKVFADKNKVAGMTIDDIQESEKIYQQYLKAFKKGVFNYISAGGGSASGGKEDPSARSVQALIPRKYFAGGMNLRVSAAMTSLSNPAQIPAVDFAQVSLKRVQVDIEGMPNPMADAASIAQEESPPARDVAKPNPIKKSITSKTFKQKDFNGIDLEHFLVAQQLNILPSDEQANNIHKGYTKQKIDEMIASRYRDPELIKYFNYQSGDPMGKAVLEAVANSADALLDINSDEGIGQFGCGVKQIVSWLWEKGDRLDYYTHKQNESPYRLTIAIDDDGQWYIQIQEISSAQFNKQTSLQHGTMARVRTKRSISPRLRQRIAQEIHERYAFVRTAGISTQVGKKFKEVNGWLDRRIFGRPYDPTLKQGKNITVRISTNEIRITDNGKGMGASTIARMFIPSEGGEKHQEKPLAESDVPAQLKKVGIIYDPTMPGPSIGFIRQQELIQKGNPDPNIHPDALLKGQLALEFGRLLRVTPARSRVVFPSDINPNDSPHVQKAIERMVDLVLESSDLSNQAKLKYINTIVAGLEAIAGDEPVAKRIVGDTRAATRLRLASIIATLRTEGVIILPHERAYDQLDNKGKTVIYLNPFLFDWQGTVGLKALGADIVDARTFHLMRKSKDGKSRTVLLVGADFKDDLLAPLRNFDVKIHDFSKKLNLPIIKTDGYVIIPRPFLSRFLHLAKAHRQGQLNTDEEIEFYSLAQQIKIYTDDETITSYEIGEVEPTVSVASVQGQKFELSDGEIDFDIRQEILALEPPKLAQITTPPQEESSTYTYQMVNGNVEEILTSPQNGINHPIVHIRGLRSNKWGFIDMKSIKNRKEIKEIIEGKAFVDSTGRVAVVHMNDGRLGIYHLASGKLILEINRSAIINIEIGKFKDERMNQTNLALIHTDKQRFFLSNDGSLGVIGNDYEFFYSEDHSLLEGDILVGFYGKDKSDSFIDAIESKNFNPNTIYKHPKFDIVINARFPAKLVAIDIQTELEIPFQGTIVDATNDLKNGTFILTFEDEEFRTTYQVWKNSGNKNILKERKIPKDSLNTDILNEPHPKQEIAESMWRRVYVRWPKWFKQAQDAFMPVLNMIPEDLKPQLESTIKPLIEDIYRRQNEAVREQFLALVRQDTVPETITFDRLPFDEFSRHMARAVEVLGQIFPKIAEKANQQSEGDQEEMYEHLFYNLMYLCTQQSFVLNTDQITPELIMAMAHGWQVTSQEQLDTTPLVFNLIQQVPDSMTAMNMVLFLSGAGFTPSDTQPTEVVSTVKGQLNKILNHPNAQIFVNQWSQAFTGVSNFSVINEAIKDKSKLKKLGKLRPYVVFLTNNVPMLEDRELVEPEGNDIITKRMSLEALDEWNRNKARKSEQDSDLYTVKDMVAQQEDIRNLPQNNSLREKIAHFVFNQKTAGGYAVEVPQNSKDAGASRLVVRHFRDVKRMMYVQELADNGPGHEAGKVLALLLATSTKSQGEQMTDLSGFFGTGKFTIFNGPDEVHIIANNGQEAFMFVFTVDKVAGQVWLERVRQLNPQSLGTGVTIRRMFNEDNTIPELLQEIHKDEIKLLAGLSQSKYAATKRPFEIFFARTEKGEEVLEPVEVEGVERLTTKENPFHLPQKEDSNPPVGGVMSVKDALFVPGIVDKNGLHVAEVKAKPQLFKMIPQYLQDHIQGLGMVFQIPMPLIRDRDTFLNEGNGNVSTQIQTFVAVEFYRALVAKIMIDPTYANKIPYLPTDNWDVDKISMYLNDMKRMAEQTDIDEGKTMADVINDINANVPLKPAHMQKLAKIFAENEEMFIHFIAQINVPQEPHSLMLRWWKVFNELREDQAKELAQRLRINTSSTKTSLDAKYHNQAVYQARYLSQETQWTEVEASTLNEKEFLILARRIAALVGFNDIRLASENMPAAGMFVGNYIIFNQSLANLMGQNAMSEGHQHIPTDTIIHEIAHFLEAMARGRLLRTGITKGQSYMAHKMSYTHQALGEFAYMMHLTAGRSLAKANQAMIEQPQKFQHPTPDTGGIDLTQIPVGAIRESPNQPINIDPATIEHLQNAPGFIGIIRSIQSVDLKSFLEIK